MPLVDHLIHAVAELESGMAEIERLFGVRPEPGGRHPQFGTHNALLSLGDGVYLEVMAPDPAAETPPQGVPFAARPGRESWLATWVLRVDAIDEAAEAARAAGVALGEVRPGARRRADGTLVEWRLTDPYARPRDGAVPFLIDWGSTPHPSLSVPPAGELISLAVEHAEPEVLRRDLAALGADVEVRLAAEYRLVAEIRTPAGDVRLR